MGNRPRIDKLPHDGADPAGPGAGAQAFCLCARPPELPPRSWRAAALDAPRMFALVVAPVDHLADERLDDVASPDDGGLQVDGPDGVRATEGVEDSRADRLDDAVSSITDTAAKIPPAEGPAADCSGDAAGAHLPASSSLVAASGDPYADATLAADDDEDAVRESSEGDGQPGEVVAWGLSFPQRAVLFLHNPLTGHDDFGIFESPERARRFYSLFGELDLIYV